MDLTIKEIKRTAKKASMYFSNGLALYITSWGERDFQCTNVYTGSGYNIRYSEVTKADLFFKLEHIPWTKSKPKP